ncbi:MAG: hypothetical protein SGI72_09115 [Planctomycetota bacterium]|nr:hypothetical protein [Planctomycetota bacterium]
MNTPTTVAIPTAMPSTENNVRAGRWNSRRTTIVRASDIVRCAAR